MQASAAVWGGEGPPECCATSATESSVNRREPQERPEILAVQRDIEGSLLALQPAVEKVAVELVQSDPDLARRFLTYYSLSHAEDAVRRWRDLAEYLITRFNDGYDTEAGPEAERGYPEGWLREVIRADPERHRLAQPGKAETRLPH